MISKKHLSQKFKIQPKMSEKELKEIAKRYFELYPDRKVLYATEDGNIFLDKSPAIDHSVKSKIKWYEVTSGDETKLRGDVDTDQEMEESLKSEALNLIDPDYKQQLRILRGLRVLPESTKKADVQLAFDALKASLLDQAKGAGIPATDGADASDPDATDTNTGAE